MIHFQVERPWRILGRLVVAAVSLSLVAAGLVVGGLWLYDRTPKWVPWQVGLIFLIAIEAIYTTALVVAAIGVPCLGLLLARRTRTMRSRLVVRGLLACISLLLALIFAEGFTAVWVRRAQRASAMPIGGFRESDPASLRTGPRKTWRPAPLIDDPIPIFRDRAGDRPINLVMLGESSAEGVPFQKWLSIDRIVAWQLRRVIAGRPIRVTSLARSGETLEKQHSRLLQLQVRPDLVIIYCGHNEFKARFSPMHSPHYYFATDPPSTTEVMIKRLEQVSPVCGVIAELAEKCRISIPTLDSRRDLIDVPVYSAGEYDALVTDFRRRLDAMVSFAERAGAITVLIMPAANDAGYGPNRSFLPAATTPRQQEEFRQAFLAASLLEEEDAAASIVRFRRLVKIQPTFAESHYRLATLLDRVGSPDEAYPHFVAARDYDGFPMRCLTAFQDVYREVASRHGCLLIDAQAYLREIGRRRLLGDDLFEDMMHPSLRGYIALSQAVLHALKDKNAFDWPQDVSCTTIDPARCAARFGIGMETWKHLCVWQKGFNEIVMPIRHDRKERLRKRLASLAAAERLSRGSSPESLGLPNIGIPDSVPMLPYANVAATEIRE